MSYFLDQTLEPVCKINKEENGSESNHGREVTSSTFFIANSDTAKLFQAINLTFNDVTLTIKLLVESAFVMFVSTMAEPCSVHFSDDRFFRKATPV